MFNFFITGGNSGLAKEMTFMLNKMTNYINIKLQ